MAKETYGVVSRSNRVLCTDGKLRDPAIYRAGNCKAKVYKTYAGAMRRVEKMAKGACVFALPRN